jgi:hypothetical protein
MIKEKTKKIVQFEMKKYYASAKEKKYNKRKRMIQI